MFFKSRMYATALLGSITTVLSPFDISAFARDCERYWNDAAQVMHAMCNANSIALNEVCYAHRPVDLAPPLFNPQDWQVGRRIGALGLTNLAATANDAGIGFSLLKLMTGGVGATTTGDHIAAHQQVVMIAFGNTVITHDISRDLGDHLGFGARAPICPGIKYAPGQTALRTLPNGGDTIYLVNVGERLNVLGRSESGAAYLVQQGTTATGWLPVSTFGLISATCETTPQGIAIADERAVQGILGNLQRTTAYSDITITNVPSTDPLADWQCSLEGFPPSGLLIINPSRQLLATVINGFEIVLQSTALVTWYRNFFTVYVLEGIVTVEGLPATAGQVIEINGAGGAPTLVAADDDFRPVQPWCNRLEELVNAAFAGDTGAPTIPDDRISFCPHAPAGYPVNLTTTICPAPQVFQNGECVIPQGPG